MPPPGAKRIEVIIPEWTSHVASLDSHLTEHAYITGPGMRATASLPLTKWKTSAERAIGLFFHEIVSWR
jgi:hypothetical protein